MILWGCRHDIDHRKKYIDRYENYDYADFKNTIIYIRGADDHGNPYIMVHKNTSPQTACTKPYIITYNKKADSIETINDLVPDSCDIDKDHFKKLAGTFIAQDIFWLFVDDNLNVYINSTTDPGQNIIREYDIAKLVDSSSLLKSTNGLVEYKQKWYIKK